MLRFKLKQLHLYILFGLVLIGCNDSVNSYLPPEETPLEKQTTEEKEALEALKQLELNTDIKNSIYLTLSNTNHSQLPSDSSFIISRETFRSVLNDYTEIHHKNTPEEDRINWIEAAVKAQNTYDIYYCKNRSKKGLFKNRLPYSGTWILPNVLNTDIVLIWKR